MRGGNYSCRIPVRHYADACLQNDERGAAEASLFVHHLLAKIKLLEAQKAALQNEINTLKPQGGRSPFEGGGGEEREKGGGGWEGGRGREREGEGERQTDTGGRKVVDGEREGGRERERDRQADTERGDEGGRERDGG